MNRRLAQFIEYKTGGNQKEFADLMGWSPQYLYKMLKGDSMGIQPVVSLLRKFPELDARWLILGDGSMLDLLRRRILDMLSLERYIPVMSRDEIDALVSGRTDFDRDTVEGWESRLAERETEIRQRFDAAYKKQKELAGNP
jgi:hypothetical protein